MSSPVSPPKRDFRRNFFLMDESLVTGLVMGKQDESMQWEGNENTAA